MATAKYRKRRAIASTGAPTPTPPTDSQADVPDPPGLEITDAVFTVLLDVSTQLQGVRTELMQIHGMARCLSDVLKYSDDDDGDQHSDVARIIGRLLNDQVTALELIRNRIPTTKEQATQIMDESAKDVET
jgi:hypothetical protein